jgi:hypothetical protein
VLSLPMYAEIPDGHIKVVTEALTNSVAQLV